MIQFIKRTLNIGSERNKREMLELRSLPLGAHEFEDWSDRIIAGAMLKGVHPSDQKFALADMITHLNATEDFKEDAYFIKRLRKVAQNQVAIAFRDSLRRERKAEIEKQEAEAKALAENPGPAPDRP